MESYQRHRSRLIANKTYDCRFSNFGNLSSRLAAQFVGDENTFDNVNLWEWFKHAKKSDKEMTGFSFVKDLNLDVGGPFESVKFRYEDDGKIYHAFTPPIAPYGSFYQYDGPQLAAFGGADSRNTGNRQTCWGSYSASDESTLDALGSTAISRCAPTNPHASALNALIELYRDGLPSAIGLNTIRRQDLGGEYLNYEFGILPTISDIKAIGSSYLKADKLLRQYYRDSGKVVRRRYSFPQVVEVKEQTTTNGVSPYPQLPSPLYVNAYGTLRKVVTETRDVWFSGAFTYFAEAPSSVLAIRDQVQKWNYLYGLEPSTSVLWEALPYSWAADWITNIGDVMNNIAMFQNDGLVMHYGYVMEHIVRRVEYVHTGTVLTGAGPVTAKQVFTTDVKRRRKATPFGFGLQLSGFTDRQWAILAALGLSRGRGAL